jgi:hypothetical protein
VVGFNILLSKKVKQTSSLTPSIKNLVQTEALTLTMQKRALVMAFKPANQMLNMATMLTSLTPGKPLAKSICLKKLKILAE